MRTETDQHIITHIVERLPLRYPQIKVAWHYKSAIIEYICYEIDHRPNYCNITGIKGESIQKHIETHVELRCNVCVGSCNINQSVELGVLL